MSYYKKIGEEIVIDIPEFTEVPVKGTVVDVIDEVVCPGEGILNYIVRFEHHLIRISTMYEIELYPDGNTTELLSRTPYKLERIIF